MLSVSATTPKENSSEAPLKFLVAPAAFVLAFLLFGAPAAPATDIVPTVNGTAYADGTLCYGGYGPDGFCRSTHDDDDMRSDCYDYLYVLVLVVTGYLHSREIESTIDEFGPFCFYSR